MKSERGLEVACPKGGICPKKPWAPVLAPSALSPCCVVAELCWPSGSLPPLLNLENQYLASREEMCEKGNQPPSLCRKLWRVAWVNSLCARGSLSLDHCLLGSKT